MTEPPFIPEEDIPVIQKFAESVFRRMEFDKSHGDLSGAVMKGAADPRTRKIALIAQGTATLQSLFWFYDEKTPEAVAVVELLKKRLKL